jgi:hypothetical protein
MCWNYVYINIKIRIIRTQTIKELVAVGKKLIYNYSNHQIYFQKNYINFKDKLKRKILCK